MSTTTRMLHPEWRDRNEPNNYPFADGVSLQNAGGDFLPPDLFLDATLYPIGGQERMYLSSVVIDHAQATLSIGDAGTPDRAFGQFDILSPPDQIPLVDAYQRSAGLLVSSAEKLAAFQAWSVGRHVFRVSETEFVASCCTPTPEIGVRGIVLDDGSIITDDVWLAGDDGVVLSTREIEINQPGCQDPVTATAIRVDVVGDPLFRRRLCETVFSTPRFLETLTVQHGCRQIVCGPDAVGDVKFSSGSHLVPDPILRVRTTEQGLVIEMVGEQLKGVQ